MPKPQEVAVLEVNGLKFEDWESVWVQQRWADSFQYFRFTAAERDPIFTKAGVFPLFEKLQFKPGDQCTVTLAGRLAVTGVIEQRQVSYDANQHGVLLIGKTETAGPAKSSVDTKTGNFDQKNIVQIAEEVLSPYGGKLKVVGSPDLTPFAKLQCERGEMVWDFLERIARTRGVIMGSDAQGHFLLIGPHSFPVAAKLKEGVNIKSCACVIDRSQAYHRYEVDAQHAASDDNSGTQASELTAEVLGKWARDNSKLITPGEHPMHTQAEAQARAQYESIWRDGSVVTATIVTQGWLYDGVNLWEPGQEIFVDSPMAMLSQTLKAQNVTFTQDSASGSLTTLELKNPEALLSTSKWDPSPQRQFEPSIRIRPH